MAKGWIEQYRNCGCSSEASRKKDLLGYCATHGTDVIVTYRIPERVLTDPQAKALVILENHGPLKPREFAKLMWPESPGWQRHARCGPNGSHQGGGMYLAAGGYLGKLARKGWVHRNFRQHPWGYASEGYKLDGPGREMLQLHREQMG